MNAALKCDYVSGHGISVHPRWTVLVGRAERADSLEFRR